MFTKFFAYTYVDFLFGVCLDKSISNVATQGLDAMWVCNDVK